MENTNQQASPKPIETNDQVELPQDQPNSIRKIVVVAGIFLVLSIVIGTGLYFLLVKSNQPSQQLNTITTPIPTSPVIQPTRESSIGIPLASIKTLKGKLLYRVNDQILVSSLDGSNPMRLIDSKNKTGFAGWSDEGRTAYYTELVETTSTLYKKDLESGLITKLFSYDSKEKNIETHFWNVRVSTDGKFAVYSHSDGDLSLYDLTENTNRKILNQKDCLSSYRAEECYGYYYPYWSPNNQRVVARKIFYEGSTHVVINPFTNPVVEKDLKTGWNSPKWSSDSSMLVIPGTGYDSGSLYLITNPDNPVTKDLL